MAKKKVSEKLHAADLKHYRDTEKYVKIVDILYKKAVDDLSSLAVKIDGVPEDKPFSFSANPGIAKEVEKVIRKLASRITAIAETGSRKEWIAACDKSNEFLEQVVKTSKLTKTTLMKYQDRNIEALAAFQERKIDGLGLSERVWKHVAPLKDEVELVTDTTKKYYKHGINSSKSLTKIERSIGTGMSAAELSREVRSCLIHPDKLFRRVRDKYGNLHLSKAAKLYHPGQGVYRSSYKNAMRVTRSEINMAYRQSDHLRWQQLDFVVGMEVNKSNNHPESDICDCLAGKYPKDFKFVGWHPQCRCYMTPILKPYDQFNEEHENIGNTEYKEHAAANQVNDVPKGFKDYIADNAERIEGWKSFPYYIKDNTEKVVGSLCEIPLNRGFDQMIKQRTLASSLLRKDKNYVDVKFDKATGGLVATHKDHHFDAVGGSYEKNVQNAGFLDGHAVIFTSEKNGKLNQRFTEGLWDGKEFEVMGCETATVNNVFRGLKHSAKKGSTKIALLEFPNGGFDENNLELALRKYYGLEKLNDGQFMQFERLVCVQGKKIVYDKPFEKKGTGGSVNRSTPRSAKVNKTSGTENIQNNKNATNSSNAANLTSQPYKRTHEEILAAAKKRQAQRTQQQKDAIQQAWDKRNQLKPINERLVQAKVDYLEVNRHKEKKTDNDIIKLVAGGDKTSGSCSSLAFCFAGNKGGYSVLDFRGGNSCDFFSRTINIKEIATSVGGKVVENYSDFQNAKDLLSTVKNGKYYYFTCGAHAAIVRKNSTGYEYLELQSSKQNGFKTLTDAELRYRFGAKRSHSRFGYKFKGTDVIIDIDLLNKDAGFKKMLGYINTESGKQKKGAGGTMK